MSHIQFFEDTSEGYGHRTYVNAASADVTLAFAVDFSTGGEKCTKDAVIKANKLYIPVNLDYSSWKIHAPYIAWMIKDFSSLNIAGNGIYTLSKYGISQDTCDDMIYYFIERLINEYECKITSIRSGGQTGVDESGLKAGVRLGVETISLCPKGWKYRTPTKDICDEQMFKDRFKDIKGT